MPTKTLTLTKTQTITTTRMMTATLALALANMAALATVPLGEKPVMNTELSCPVVSFTLQESCGKDKFQAVSFRCEGEGENLLADDGGNCHSADIWQEKLDLWCHNQCTQPFYYEKELDS